MKPFKLLLAVLASFALSTIVLAQGSETFVLVDYMKVKPGKRQEYVNAETKVWKLIHQERLKQGKITGWWFYEIRYPSGTATEYDFVIVTQVEGWPAVNGFYSGWTDAFKGLTKEQTAVVDKTESLRDLVRHEAAHLEESVFRPDMSTNPPNYLIVNYMDVPTGRWDEYFEMESRIMKPIFEETMKTSGRQGWALYYKWGPSGDSYPYNAVTVDFYNKWEDIGQDGNFSETLKKVHPHISESFLERKVFETRTLWKNEWWVRVDGIDGAK